MKEMGEHQSRESRLRVLIRMQEKICTGHFNGIRTVTQVD